MVNAMVVASLTQRPASLRRSRTPRASGPSHLTGPQTAKKRKPGSRVTAKGIFKGSGRAMNEHVEDEEQKKAGTGFRKQAASKRAREERALAAERRLVALQEAEASGSDLRLSPQPGPSSLTTRLDSGERLMAIESPSNGDNDTPSQCADVQSLPEGGTVATTAISTAHGGQSRVQETSSGAVRTNDSGSGTGVPWPEASRGTTARNPPQKRQKLSYGALVQEEISLRKKESLGMDGTGRRLGRSPSGLGAMRDVLR